jgi:YfiH family protein
VKSLQTTRAGGVSVPPYESLNLGAHVKDDEQSVLENRRRLGESLPNSPLWLQQVHGTVVVNEQQAKHYPQADGSFTEKVNEVCTVMTADCLPILFCNESGTQVAAVHAGWRGLADGVVEEALAQFQCDPDSVMAWLGPAIGPSAFEVGLNVYDAFCSFDSAAKNCFKKQPDQFSPDGKITLEKWHADLYMLARLRLSAAGVNKVYGGDFCTYSDNERFFSYRRDGETGRMASCIWLSH